MDYKRKLKSGRIMGDSVSDLYKEEIRLGEFKTVYSILDNKTKVNK